MSINTDTVIVTCEGCGYEIEIPEFQDFDLMHLCTLCDANPYRMEVMCDVDPEEKH